MYFVRREDLGNEHGFRSKEYISIAMRPFGEAKTRELILKVDNIISLRRFVIPNENHTITFSSGQHIPGGSCSSSLPARSDNSPAAIKEN